MPRRSRLQAGGVPAHVIQRGNNRQACFYAEADYQYFLHHLSELAKRFKCEVHAYVLMTNHMHLLLTSELERGPSSVMPFAIYSRRQLISCIWYCIGSLYPA